MNAGQEDFDKLRKLLALKRHEQPPPGYFDRLPNRIVMRIQAGEGNESFWEGLLPKVLLRPAFAYGFGLAACVLLAFGANYAFNTDPATGPATPLLTAQPQEGPAVASNPSFLVASNNMASSTNPVNPKPLWEPNIQVLPAGYSGQNH